MWENRQSLFRYPCRGNRSKVSNVSFVFAFTLRVVPDAAGDVLCSRDSGLCACPLTLGSRTSVQKTVWNKAEKNSTAEDVKTPSICIDPYREV